MQKMALANVLEIDPHNMSILSSSFKCLCSVVVSLLTFVLKASSSTPIAFILFLPFFKKKSIFLLFLTELIFFSGLLEYWHFFMIYGEVDIFFYKVSKSNTSVVPL